MTVYVPVDGLDVYATSADVVTYDATLAAATDPETREAAYASVLDLVVGGHWGTLPPQ